MLRGELKRVEVDIYLYCYISFHRFWNRIGSANAEVNGPCAEVCNVIYVRENLTLSLEIDDIKEIIRYDF